MDRRRAQGEGRPATCSLETQLVMTLVSLETQLVMTLVSLRIYPTFAVLAFLSAHLPTRSACTRAIPAVMYKRPYRHRKA